MKTVVLGTPPPELEAMIARRRALGHDLYDEVWQGEYHMAPAAHPDHGYLDHRLAVMLEPSVARAGLIGIGPFNLGDQDDFRVPDRGFHRTRARQAFVPTAAIVVEIVSPDDETYAKFGFYFARGVEELLVVDPATRTVTWYQRSTDRFEAVPASALLGLAAAAIADALTW